MKNIFFASVLSVIAFQYTSVMVETKLPYWNHYLEKPFVLRALIPALGESLLGALIVTTLFGVGLGLAMIYAYKRYWVQSLRNDIALVVSFFITTFILMVYQNYYDYASAFFMLVMLLLWMEKKDLIFLPVFALASLNRETSILIIPVLFFIRRSNALWISVLLFALIRTMLVYVHADALGQEMYFTLTYNIRTHLDSIIATIGLLLALGWLLTAFFKKIFTIRPEFAIYIIILMPCLFGAYLLVGLAFEIRIFAEVVPLLLMSALMENK